MRSATCRIYLKCEEVGELPPGSRAGGLKSEDFSTSGVLGWRGSFRSRPRRRTLETIQVKKTRIMIPYTRVLPLIEAFCVIALRFAILQFSYIHCFTCSIARPTRGSSEECGGIPGWLIGSCGGAVMFVGLAPLALQENRSSANRV